MSTLFHPIDIQGKICKDYTDSLEMCFPSFAYLKSYKAFFWRQDNNKILLEIF